MTEVFEIKTKHGLVALHWNFVCAMRYDTGQPFVYINYSNGIQFNLEFADTNKMSGSKFAKQLYSKLLIEWHNHLMGITPTT